MTSTPAVPPAPRRTGRDVAVAAAVLLAALGGAAAAWLLVAFQLFGEVADRGDHESAAELLGSTALAVAVLGAVCCLALRSSLWVVVVTALTAGALLLAALDQHGAAQALPGDGSGGPGPGALLVSLGVPTSWPLAALALGALVVAVTRRGPAGPAAPEPGRERVGA